MCTIAQTRFRIQNSLGEQEIKKGRFPMTPQPNDWRHLAEQASNEMNPEKMMELIGELNRVLERREQTEHQQRHQNQ
jgi:hypothetical protein